MTRFRLSFDYMAEAVISKTTGDPGITRLVESFAAMGAPWLSGIRDIQSLARELGLNLSRTSRPPSSMSLPARRPMTSPIFGFYSVCTLGSVSDPADGHAQECRAEYPRGRAVRSMRRRVSPCSPTFASWSQVTAWLLRIDGLRRVA